MPPRLFPDIPLYIGKKAYDIVKVSAEYRRKPSYVHPCGFLSDGVPVTVGDITVTPFLCDHSAFDSYMLLCESNGRSVLYTGDFRSTGRKSFDRLLSVLPDSVDILICEGTTLSRPAYLPVSESMLEQQASELFKSTDGPVFVLQSSANIDRTVTMYRAARKNHRVFLQELYMAQISACAGKNIPNPGFNDVFTFITTPARYEELEKFRHRVGKNRIAGMNFVMCVRISMLPYIKRLSETMSFKGGILVYSIWDGYRRDEKMKEFLSECTSLGLKIKSLHTGGHADAATIRTLMSKVNAKRVIPVHTLSPETLLKLTDDIATQ